MNDSKLVSINFDKKSKTKEPNKKKTKIKIPIVLKSLGPNEVNFVIDYWLNSHRESPHAKLMTNSVYFKHHRPIVMDIISRARTLIAVNPDDETQAYGFAVTENLPGFEVLHYIFIKELFRKMGVGRRLLHSTLTTENDLMFTHHSRDIEPFLKHTLSGRRLIYNPYRR